MDSIDITFLVLFPALILLRFRLLMKARKKQNEIFKERHNSMLRTSNVPERELTWTSYNVLVIFIELIEILFVMMIFWFAVPTEPVRHNVSSETFVFSYLGLLIIMYINLWLKHKAYEQGKWLSRYKYKRLMFLVPLIGGFILTIIHSKKTTNNYV